MNNIDGLTVEEELSLTLSALYESYGFLRYKTTKFEKYSLYGENENFLGTDRVITFTTDGALLALRPDVTLSIVKNTNATNKGCEKLFYTEKVYRYDKESKSFKEISQVGVETLGDVDTTTMAEVTELALKSLKSLSDDFVLDLSSVEFITQTFDSYGITDGELKAELSEILKQKNNDAVEKLLLENRISKEFAEAFVAIIGVGDEPEIALNKIKPYVKQDMQNAFDELKAVTEALKQSECYGGLRIDFSVVSDCQYYNGITFNGYVLGMPKAVLKGGRYDGLAKKMKKDIGAAGFAVYVGDLANAHHTKQKPITILLTSGASDAEVLKEANALREKGYIVRVAKTMPCDINAEKAYGFENGKLKVIK
ncbi:MAG: ATP phosphoribosyltransferase regulatory subunit [Christensenellales bacterium]